MGKMKELTMEQEEIYVVEWGFHSSNDAGSEIKAICSSYDRAEQIVKEDIQNICKEEQKGYWTDGDYWIRIFKAYLDSSVLTVPQYELDKMFS